MGKRGQENGPKGRKRIRQKESDRTRQKNKRGHIQKSVIKLAALGFQTGGGGGGIRTG